MTDLSKRQAEILRLALQREERERPPVQIPEDATRRKPFLRLVHLGLGELAVPTATMATFRLTEEGREQARTLRAAY